MERPSWKGRPSTKDERTPNGRQFRRVADDPLKIIVAAERRLCSHLKKLRKKGAINDDDHDKMRPVGSRPGIFYGLPKVHKAKVPMRPILSSIDTYNYQTCKFLVPILEPLTTGSFTNKDSFDFVSQITSRNDADQLSMASLDVESLFTNIPAEETISICTEDLFGPQHNVLKIVKDDFKQLLQFSMECNYFRFGGQMYQQIDGVSMDSPISPALANAFLLHYEQQWLNNGPDEYRPVFYRRHVDDTFVLVRQPNHLAKFLTYINSFHPNMKFTAEAETNGQLSFLDILVQRSGRNFTTTTHRKKTASNQMMNYETTLPAIYKENVHSCLVQRAHHICSRWTNFNSYIQNLKGQLCKTASRVTSATT